MLTFTVPRCERVGTALLYELIVEDRMKIRKVIVASSQAVYGEGQYICQEHGRFFYSSERAATAAKRMGGRLRAMRQRPHPRC